MSFLLNPKTKCSFLGVHSLSLAVFSGSRYRNVLRMRLASCSSSPEGMLRDGMIYQEATRAYRGVYRIQSSSLQRVTLQKILASLSTIIKRKMEKEYKWSQKNGHWRLHVNSLQFNYHDGDSVWAFCYCAQGKSVDCIAGSQLLVYDKYMYMKVWGPTCLQLL